MANPLAVWGLYSMLGVSAATGVGIATGTIPLEPIEQTLKGLFQPPETAKASIVSEQEVAKLPGNPDPKVDAPAVEPAEPEAKPKPLVGPAFDVLRVEKDGSVVVAGRAPANSSVDLLMSDGTKLGTAKSGSSGDFVIILDNPLKPGDYSLVLRATKPDADPLISKEVATVHIPSTEGGEVLALVTEDGQASRILIKPEPVEVVVAEAPKIEQPKAPEPKAPEPEVEEPVVVAAVEPEETVKSDAPSQDAAKPVVQETAEVVPTPEPEVEKAEPETVLVEAVEVENGTLFIAGATKPGSTIRLYLNNEPLGVARGTSDGRFLLQKKFDLKAGRHLVRADVIDRTTGEAVARAEVPLLHEPVRQVAVAKPTPPKEEPQVVPEPVAEKPAVESKEVKPDPVVETEPEVAESPARESDTPVEVAENETDTEAEIDEDIGVIRTGSTIIIKPGDNLWRISRKTYGAGIRYTTIFNANRDQIRDPSRIYIGQIFKIPETAVQ